MSNSCSSLASDAVRGTGATSVLLVDDSDAIRLVLTDLLASMSRPTDFTVVDEARTGSQAINLAGRHQPDLVILDIDMPEMGGLAALPRILAVAPGTQVIVHSAAEAREVAIKLGAAAFVPKGDCRSLVESIETLARSASASD
ncbi:MAG: hypothetical protein NVS3B24_14730 [Candidatus Dormibacteria bacterium]